jgi:hypothetical protein
MARSGALKMGFRTPTEAGQIIWESFRKMSDLKGSVDKTLAIQYMVYMCGCPIAEVCTTRIITCR